MDNHVTTVYEGKKNIILDDGKNYIFVHKKSDAKCEFDRDHSVLCKVIDIIHKYGEYDYDKNTHVFRLSKKTPESASYTLLKVLFSAYSGRSLKLICKSGRLRTLDGDKHNGHKNNLYLETDDNEDTINRSIRREGDRIHLYLKNSKVETICNNEPELYKILLDPRISWTFDEGWGIKGTVRLRGKGETFTFFLHQLVIAWRENGARRDNYVTKIQSLQTKWDAAGKNIDHLNNDVYNNMDWNLSVMSKSVNSAKGTLFIKVKDPYFLFGVYDHNENLYKFVYGNGHDLRESRWFICKTEDHCLNFLTMIANFYADPKAEGTCFGNYSLYVDAALLLNMNIDEFEIWNTTNADINKKNMEEAKALPEKWASILGVPEEQIMDWLFHSPVQNAIPKD